MGLLALQRLMSLQCDRQRRQRRTRALNGSIDSSMDIRKGSPCQQDAHGDSHAAKRMMCSIPTLPEDILHHIYSLLPLRDAARAACSSHAFLRFWRCHPNLTLNWHILGLNANASQENFSCIIDNILRNHSGINIKILKLQLYGIYDANQYLDSWLQVAVKPGIEQLTIELCYRVDMKHNVPCTLLTDGVQNSIRYLQLSCCAFHPTPELGPFRNLKSLLLRSVHILDNELECFLSNSHALEKLDLNACEKITCLKIPSILLQLHSLKVSRCLKLRVIQSKARNLSCFILQGQSVKVSLGETLQMKNLCMGRSNLVCYARVKLLSSMPNLKTLSISSHYEVAEESMQHESIFGGGSLQLRQMPEQHHGRLKTERKVTWPAHTGYHLW
ncbi:unnamed protein product [Miscanthus lutarioriparius]|uniref:F-box domain-containing protein n=1 Tax=Miscanthus lutarioriparius TaxID=422564 RepID=A0A811PTA1_9POAL|nr:unnamed protein product [Miscanthus lutarioriparius]